jgi:hypothetical protein
MEVTVAMMSEGERCRSLRAILPLAGLLLLLLSFSACRGENAGKRNSGYIPVHVDAREALAAYEAQDQERLERALGRLAQISERPELLASQSMIRKVGISRGGRYLVLLYGESLGGSKVLLLNARTGRLLLGLRGYGESFSSDDRWLACLQHRYATPREGGEVGAYEALLLVDMSRVRGAKLDDPAVFRTLVQDPDANFMRGKTSFITDEHIEIFRKDPPLRVAYSLDGKEIKGKGRRWKFMKLF